MIKTALISLIPLLFSSFLSAEDYPNMVGTWKGHIRVMSSGSDVADQVAQGGAVLSEIDLRVIFEHQDGETFIGKSRSSTTPRNEPSTPIWGALRSTGDEALFVTGGGGRGHLWLKSANEFEYCITNLEEIVITAYCGMMKRE